MTMENAGNGYKQGHGIQDHDLAYLWAGRIQMSAKEIAVCVVTQIQKLEINHLSRF